MPIFPGASSVGDRPSSCRTCGVEPSAKGVTAVDVLDLVTRTASVDVRSADPQAFATTWRALRG
jgi:hypothetical protein